MKGGVEDECDKNTNKILRGLKNESKGDLRSRCYKNTLR